MRDLLATQALRSLKIVMYQPTNMDLQLLQSASSCLSLKTLAILGGSLPQAVVSLPLTAPNLRFLTPSMVDFADSSNGALLDIADGTALLVPMFSSRKEGAREILHALIACPNAQRITFMLGSP